MTWLYGLIAIFVSCVLLYVAGNFLIGGLTRLSRYFKITEFVVAFFILAFAATLPNFFIGITSAFQGIPELSFGEIMGSNIIVMTLAVSLSVFFAAKKELPIEGDMVKDTAFLTSISAILPLILISDGFLSRSDGLVLILLFIGYVYWLLVRQNRFSKVFQDEEENIPRSVVLTDIVKVVISIVLVALSAQGVVYGSSIFAEDLNIPLVIVGAVILAFGGALPEIYFSIISSIKGETNLIVGGLLGAVIIPATLVLGLTAVIHPIQNDITTFPLINRVFLIVIALFLLYTSQVKKAITWRESVVLIILYFLFLFSLFIM